MPNFGMIAVAEAQSVVKEIRIEGNRRVEPETVRSYLQFNEGDAYDSYAVDQSLKALFATGLFSDVNISRDGGVVVVTLVENPVINRVSFEGNSEVDDASLETEVQLKPRSIFTRARVQADVQRVQDVYKRQGLFAAQVEPKIIELEQNRVDLVFEISEGPTTKVQSINFVGNRAFSDGELRGVVTTSESNFFSFLKPTDVYDADRLNLDRELLRQYYIKNGYADAQIVSAMADLDPNGSGFFITFTIEEGEVYTFGNVVVESNIADVDVASVERLVSTEAGEIYDASRLERSIEAMTLNLSEQGFAFAQVRPRIERDPIGRTISIVYTVEEGPRIYIERINVVGNTRTKDHVIRREFRLIEGDAFNKLLVSRARKRLENLGFFKKVSVGAEPGSAADRVIIVVEVEEQSTGELSFGGGYSSSEGVIGDITLKERNLLGNGQFVQIKVGGSAERLQFDVSFTEPRFLDQDISAGIDAFHKTTTASDNTPYNTTKTGGVLRLGFPLSDESSLFTRYSFVYDSIYDVDTDRQVSKAITELVDDGGSYEAYTSSVGYTLTYDTRNNKMTPSRGYYFELAQDLAGLGGDVFYIRTSAEGRAYFPISEQFTFVTRVAGGHIAGWNGDDVRLLDLFYKGGETIRGFENSGYGPRDLTPGDGNNSLGGKFYYVATAEVRFPLPYIPEELGLSGAVFADAGSLFGANDTAKDNIAAAYLKDDETIRSSIGASVLWNSPVGPLRADFAYVLSDEAYDEQQWFKFGASTRF